MEKQKIKIAILSFSSILMISMIASAILADIAAQFPDVNQSVIQMVLTIPSLTGMVFALSSGPLSSKIPKKTMVLFGLYSAFVGGMIGFAFGKTSIYVLFAASFLIGISQGINSTMSMALIADYFAGDERSSLMGLQSAFVNGGSMLILLIAGFLGGIQWNYSYLIFFILVPVIVIVTKNLPSERVVVQNTVVSDENDKLNSVVFITCAIVLGYSILAFVFQSNISMYVSSNGLGDASTSGMANSIMTGAGALTGIFYGKIKKVFKNYIFSLAIGSVALGMLLIYSVGNLLSVFVASVLAGFALSAIIPSAMFVVSNAVSPSKSATAIAMANASSNIGMFFSPFIINPLSSALGYNNVSFKFLISGVGLIAMCLIALISFKRAIKTN